jgi:hypothetical protein
MFGSLCGSGWAKIFFQFSDELSFVLVFNMICLGADIQADLDDALGGTHAIHAR